LHLGSVVGKLYHTIADPPILSRNRDRQLHHCQSFKRNIWASFGAFQDEIHEEVQHFLTVRLNSVSDNLSRNSTAVAAVDQLSTATASLAIITGLITVAIPVTVPERRSEVACPFTLRFLLTIPVTHGGCRFALGSPRRPRGYRLATTGW